MAHQAGLDPSAVPATGLAELAALVAHARLVISGDTGVAPGRGPEAMATDDHTEPA